MSRDGELEATQMHDTRTHRRGLTIHPRRIWLLLLCLSLAPGTIAETEEATDIRVVYVLGNTIYLSAGRADGLEVGQRLVVIQDGEPEATLEVTFVADHSASCQILEERGSIVVGDRVVPLAVEGETGQPAVPKPSRSAVETERGPAPEPATSTAEPQPEAPAVAAPRKPIPSLRKPRQKKSSPSWGKLSGTVALSWQHFEDGSDAGRDFDQSTVRLNLRMRELGGSPYEVNIRVRGREDRRLQTSGETESFRRDRLYEASVTYDPPDGKYYYQAGRLRSGPLIGFDYLDGILGEYRIKPRIGIGGFYGTRSDIEELSFDSSGQTYGVFFHYRRQRSRESPFYADVMIGGIGEYLEGDVSREYLSVYGRLGSGNRWTLYQRADVDFNRDWRRELTGESYQVSNLLVAATYRFNEALRVGLTYDQRRRFRDLDNRDTPEERFDDRLRDGLRGTLYLGKPRGWRLTTSLGTRRQEGTSEDSNILTGSLYHADLAGWRLLLGFDYSGFSGATSDGQRFGLRLRKYFRGGHDLGLTLGYSETDSVVTGLVRENQWVRLSGTTRLPKNFFILWEAEVSEGDDLEGQRLNLQLGYRL